MIYCASSSELNRTHMGLGEEIVMKTRNSKLFLLGHLQRLEWVWSWAPEVSQPGLLWEVWSGRTQSRVVPGGRTAQDRIGGAGAEL